MGRICTVRRTKARGASTSTFALCVNMISIPVRSAVSSLLRKPTGTAIAASHVRRRRTTSGASSTLNCMAGNFKKRSRSRKNRTMKIKRKNRPAQQPRPARPFEVTLFAVDQSAIDAIVSDTRRRLAQGEEMRCACCLGWVEPTSAGIGAYVSSDGNATPYVLCPKCALLVTVSESARRRVSAYVAGVN